MIISASYKTDIPAFYGEWFSNRLRAGYCKTLNHYSQAVQHVSLRPDDVTGFVFWTKNIGSFFPQLAEVHALGLPFIVQHTINGYPAELEKAVVDPGRAVEHLRRVADLYGPRVCVWRYDTIIESSLTPSDFHVETFSRLAQALEGATDEVTVSFVRLYQKTERNLNQAAQQSGFTFAEPDEEWKQKLLRLLATIATGHGMQLTVCAHSELITEGCREASCVDVNRLGDIAATTFKARRRGNRQDCACYESRDIGEYDTCPHGCAYCYAVQSRALALSRFRAHDPSSEMLFAPTDNNR